MNSFTDIQNEAANDSAQETSDLKYIHTLFHELKIPISSINGYLSLLVTGELGKLSKPQIKVIQKARELSLYTAELISNIASISRLESNRAVHYEKVDLADIVRKAISTLNIQIKSKKLNINKDTGFIWALPIDLEQIMVNILSNAVKFTPQSKDIFISAKLKGNTLILECKDTGIGIPKESLSRISTDFYRADNVVRQYEGSGLGLSIVKKLVNFNRGELAISSRLNEGTCVSITLKLLADKDVFDTELEQYIKHCSQGDDKFGLLMIAGGDVTNADISEVLRSEDRVYTVEKEKSVIIFPNADYTQVRLVCDRLRSIFQEKKFLNMAKHKNKRIKDISLAFAIYPDDGKVKKDLLSYLNREISMPGALLFRTK
ncbi:MAG: ATP-binding protein [Candidatus Omnitrophica bacterium]|nr:ATP-binding protein [Candidatus Omnitrophota bacterium]